MDTLIQSLFYCDFSSGTRVESQKPSAIRIPESAYAKAAANYNQAQYRLMGAMGNLVGR